MQPAIGMSKMSCADRGSMQNSYKYFGFIYSPDGFSMGVVNVLDQRASIMDSRIADAHSVPIQKTSTC